MSAVDVLGTDADRAADADHGQELACDHGVVRVGSGDAEPFRDLRDGD
jgi:hypothetical protein